MASTLFWLLLLLVASRRRGVTAKVFAGVFLVLFALSSGVQGALFSFFGTYGSVDADLYTRSWCWPLVGSAPLGSAKVLVHLLLGVVEAVVLLWVARKLVRPRRRLWRAALPFAAMACVSLWFVRSSYRPVQASTPDVLYFHGVVASYKEQVEITHTARTTKPQHRRPRRVPRLTSSVLHRPNVLLVLQESQRFDVTCTEYDPNCARANRTSNHVVPGRIPFLRWRSLDSSTFLSCATLWTGMLPSDPLEALETAPTLFAYAKATGYETAYFSSHHVFLKNMRQQIQNEPLDHFACATTLDPLADWDTGARDALLSDYVIERWDKLVEPFFVVAHYSNQHLPYVVDRADSPFEVDPHYPSSLENPLANRNVVYLSDRAVGRLLDKVRSADSSSRTVVLFTSDHGEGFGEHGRVGHTMSLFDEEIHVPAWIDAPTMTVTDSQRQALYAARDAWVTHADFAPTVLDLMGVWDEPALASFRAGMTGRPLTRETGQPPALPLTNNSWIWESVDRSWGYMQGPWKLHVTDGLERYRCFDLENDPREIHDLGEEACGDLGARARALFPSAATAQRPYRPLR